MKKKIFDTPSSSPIMDQPENAMQMINKYGTYNIQPTNDTDNPYPAISQGLSEQDAKTIQKERDHWVKKQRKEHPEDYQNKKDDA